MSELIGLTDLLKTTERRFVTANIPGLGKARFRSMTAAEHLELEQSFLDAKGATDMRKFKERTARMVIKTLCNGDGLLICTEDHIPELLKLDARVMDAMADVINEHCVNRKRVDEMVGNWSGECLSEHSVTAN